MKLPARTATAAASALTFAALAGCSAINPITTKLAYDPSDGVSVEVGGVTGYNLMVVTTGAGEPATLLGSLRNPSGEDVEVAASIDGTAIVTVTVPAGGTVKLGGDEDDAAVTGTSPVAPGHLAEVTFQTPEAGQVKESVPVLDGTLPEYAHELERLG